MPLPPSQDTFYTPPPHFESLKPGAILRIRPAPGLVPVIGNSSAAYNILYRTTGTRGQPSWAVTTVLVPRTTSKAAPKKLISYQLAYDTPSFDWSPSYGLYNVYSHTNVFNSTPEPVHVSEALGRGWYVSVPDYEGPQASFMEGPQAAHAILDGIRAATLMDLTGSHGIQVGLWGYSGGGYATAWAAELQSEYAPDLNISAIAVGAPLTNFTGSFEAHNEGTMSFIIPSALVGLVSQFPEANASLANALHKDGPFNATGFYSVTQRNLYDNAAVYQYQDMLNYFINRQPPLEIPHIPDLVSSQTPLGVHGIPKVPYFAYMAVHDMLGIGGFDSLVAKYCTSGANILYQRNTVGGHVADSVNGVPGVLAFFDAVFEGTFALQGCKVENVTIAISTQPDL